MKSPIRFFNKSFLLIKCSLIVGFIRTNCYTSFSFQPVPFCTACYFMCNFFFREMLKNVINFMAVHTKWTEMFCYFEKYTSWNVEHFHGAYWLLHVTTFKREPILKMWWYMSEGMHNKKKYEWPHHDHFLPHIIRYSPIPATKIKTDSLDPISLFTPPNLLIIVLHNILCIAFT